MKLFTEEDCRRAVGLPFEIQQQLRSGDFAFITEMGRQLQIDEHVLCTANYMVNLFFIRRSYLNYDRHIVSTAALMLACKSHNYKRLNKKIYPNTFASTYHSVLHRRLHSTSERQPPVFDDTLKTEYLVKIFKAEFKLLKTLEFDVDIDQPLYYLESIINKLYTNIEDKTMFLTMARVMTNESMRSIAPLCIRTLGVAVACVVLAGVICNLPRPQNLVLINADVWWTVISPDLTLAEITQAIRLIMEALTLK
jgi:Cyclin, N-terminal domain